MNKRWLISFVLASIGTACIGGCARSDRAIGVVAAQEEPGRFGGRFASDDRARVYFAGQPSEEGLRQVADQGVVAVVNFRTEGEMRERVDFDEGAIVRGLGMEYATIPVTPDTFSPADADRLAAVLNETNEPVLLHCSSGNRVAAVWALYLHRHHGMDVEVAIERARPAGLTKDVMVQAVRRAAAE